MLKTDVITRNNVTVHGTSKNVLMLAHGFGCDQRMWRFVLPALAEHFTVVLFDYVGSGKSELSSFSVDKYSTLEGYATDVLEIISELDYEKVVFCGHSVSCMIGLIASLRSPEKFSELIMICPSPCFINDLPEYEGGFEKTDLQELMNLMDKNYIGWAEYLAPLVLGASSSKKLIGELSGSFCSTDPIVAKTFAQATFFSDHRQQLPQCVIKTLIIQSESDSLAPVSVGRYIHDRIEESELKIVEVEGHCVHMTEPSLTAGLITEFLAR